MNPLLTKSQARAMQPLANAVSSSSSLPGYTSALQSELPQQAFLEGGVNCIDREFRDFPSTLAAWKEKPLAEQTVSPVKLITSMPKKIPPNKNAHNLNHVCMYVYI